jgi:hypothetical protein
MKRGENFLPSSINEEWNQVEKFDFELFFSPARRKFDLLLRREIFTLSHV